MLSINKMFQLLTVTGEQNKHRLLILARVFLPTGTGPETAVTGVTGPDRFRYRPVANRPNSKFNFEFKKMKKILKNF